jgi:hypothetical protein
MGMKGSSEGRSFRSSTGIVAFGSDHGMPKERQQAEKRFPEDPPFFCLQPSVVPFLVIPIETKEMTNGNRWTNHSH